MEIVKRSGTKVLFDKSKISNAILKAMKYGSGIVKEDIAKDISDEIELIFEIKKTTPTVHQIEAYVYNILVGKNEYETAKCYEGYRAVQNYKRETINTTDESILGLVNLTNVDVMNENSNKDAKAVSTQRDLIAGEVSKDLVRRKILPARIVQAHDEGMVHFHDEDYFLQLMPNCCLVNLKDMLDNGTVINGNMVETPRSFQTACTVATQIMAQIASGQYGGQTISLSHLAPYVRVSYNKYKKQVLEEGIKTGVNYTEKQLKKIAMLRTKKEIESGVQTIQYQILTLNSTNGQSPFVSLFMWINEDEEYIEEMAMLIEEVIKQRKLGIKNRKGVYVTPTFPKLLYVTDDNNIYSDSKYYYLTEQAVSCTAKRLNPDFISAKIMKENVGYVFPCIN